MGLASMVPGGPAEDYRSQLWRSRAGSYLAAPSNSASKYVHAIESGSQHHDHLDLEAVCNANSPINADSDLLELLGLNLRAPGLGTEQASPGRRSSKEIPLACNLQPDEEVLQVITRLLGSNRCTGQSEEHSSASASIQAQAAPKKLVIPALPVEKGCIVPLLPIASIYSDATPCSSTAHRNTSVAQKGSPLGDRSSGGVIRDFREPGAFISR
jgi:hypothetical protein